MLFLKVMMAVMCYWGSFFPSNFTNDGGLKFSDIEAPHILPKRGWGFKTSSPTGASSWCHSWRVRMFLCKSWLERHNYSIAIQVYVNASSSSLLVLLAAGGSRRRPRTGSLLDVTLEGSGCSYANHGWNDTTIPYQYKYMLMPHYHRC